MKKLKLITIAKGIIILASLIRESVMASIGSTNSGSTDLIDQPNPFNAVQAITTDSENPFAPENFIVLKGESAIPLTDLKYYFLKISNELFSFNFSDGELILSNKLGEPIDPKLVKSSNAELMHVKESTNGLIKIGVVEITKVHIREANLIFNFTNEEVAQWYNWPNWPNWPNWGNWRNY